MGTYKERILAGKDELEARFRSLEPLSDEWLELAVEIGLINADHECYLTDGEYVSVEEAVALGII